MSPLLRALSLLVVFHCWYLLHRFSFITMVCLSVGVGCGSEDSFQEPRLSFHTPPPQLKHTVWGWNSGPQSWRQVSLPIGFFYNFFQVSPFSAPPQGLLWVCLAMLSSKPAVEALAGLAGLSSLQSHGPRAAGSRIEPLFCSLRRS